MISMISCRSIVLEIVSNHFVDYLPLHSQFAFWSLMLRENHLSNTRKNKNVQNSPTQNFHTSDRQLLPPYDLLIAAMIVHTVHVNKDPQAIESITMYFPIEMIILYVVMFWSSLPGASRESHQDACGIAGTIGRTWYREIGCTSYTCTAVCILILQQCDSGRFPYWQEEICHGTFRVQ